jgi:hypothetical protein
MGTWVELNLAACLQSWKPGPVCRGGVKLSLCSGSLRKKGTQHTIFCPEFCIELGAFHIAINLFFPSPISFPTHCCQSSQCVTHVMLTAYHVKSLDPHLQLILK